MMTNANKRNAAMHVFIQYLASKDALDQWLFNVCNTTNVRPLSYYEPLTSQQTKQVLINGFSWRRTKEGNKYWRAISVEWREDVYPKLIEHLGDLDDRE